MDWLGLVLEPERPGRRPAAGKPPAIAAGTIVQQYRPATADQWRLTASAARNSDFSRSWSAIFSTSRWCSEPKKVMPTPVRPARPVRPTRCT